MTVQNTDVFVVSRGGTLHSVTAANANGKIQDTDLLVVRRGTATYKITGKVFKAAAFQDGDLFIVNRNNQSYKATGALVKAILRKAPIIKVVTLAEDDDKGAAFTSQAFTATITMSEPGLPVSTRGLKAWVEGDLTTQLVSTNTITAVTPGAAGTSATKKYKNVATAEPNPTLAQNVVYGKIPQDNALAAGQPAGTYPVFEWINGINTGAGINGYNDWYIPAKNELSILYFFLKPGSGTNHAPSGSNPNSVAPYTPNTTYSPGFPDPANTPTLFQSSGGTQAFITTNYYWSSSENSDSANSSWAQIFSIGAESGSAGKSQTFYARAIRRIPIADYVAAGSPAIGSYLAGGFYGGQISTAGNGIADYALIVSPRAQGEYGVTGYVQASLTIAGAQTDGFQVGDGITPPAGTPSTGIQALDDTKVDVYGTTGFKVGDKIHLVPKTTPGSRLYLVFNAAGTVSDLQSADPGYVQTTNQANPKLTFPATFPSGKTPDEDLPTGTTITVEAQATNVAGTVTKTSNTLTPSR